MKIGIQESTKQVNERLEEETKQYQSKIKEMRSDDGYYFDEEGSQRIVEETK